MSHSPTHPPASATADVEQPMPEQEATTARWFVRLTEWVHGLLPTRGRLGVLGRGTDATMIGFLLLSGSGFLVDMAVLWITKGLLGITFPVAVSISYGAASLYNFLMNRALNFEAHGHLGGQSVRWTVVAVSNYLLWILGLAWLLEHLGLYYLVARLSVTVIETTYLYLMARLWVFRGVHAPGERERRPHLT